MTVDCLTGRDFLYLLPLFEIRIHKVVSCICGICSVNVKVRGFIEMMEQRKFLSNSE